MTESDSADTSFRRSPWPIAAIGLGLLAMLLAGLSFYLVDRLATPANDSADVGFVRDMSVHHAQAVEMANIAYRRTEDPEIARIALDIATTQQFQIGMMTGWLDIWGRTVSSDLPLMGWMGNFDMTLSSPPPGLDDPPAGMDMGAMDHSATPAAGNSEIPIMPGMATQSQVDELQTLPPAQMDIRFLQLMIRHHQGGVMMAHAALEKAEDEHVRNFAQQVIDTQDAEIATMLAMLDERMATAATPVASPVAATPVAPAIGTPASATPVSAGT